MYSSGYAKYSPPAKKAMQYHSKGKSCGYYMRIIFFFSSLIQSLIIVSLVLFLIYGKKQDSASVSRIQDLEESFSRLSIENVALRHQRKNLTTLLNSTVTEKARIAWELATCRYYANISLTLIPDLEKRNQQCLTELFMCKTMTRLPGSCPPFVGNCNCGPLANELQARLSLVEANFTQTTQKMKMDMDQIIRERDNLHLEAIRLRRDKTTHEREVKIYRQRCKEDFVLSLRGVLNVTKAFLEKIDTLFPNHIAFQLTCPNQREHLDQIRTNCTSLSREVEDKFQRYLNDVGLQVSNILSENSRLKAENQRLYEDYRWCSYNRTDMIQQHRRDKEQLQQKHDKDKEKILEEKVRLTGDIDVLNSNINFKNKEVDHLREQLKQLNASCMAKPGLGSFPGFTNPRAGNNGWGSSSSSSTDFGRTGSGLSFGSAASAFNKPASTGQGSPSFPGGSSSSLGSTFNRLGSTGTGSSSSSIFGGGSSSSTGSAFGRTASPGAGSSSSSLIGGGSSSSTGSAFGRTASTGTGSSSSSIFGGGSSSSTGSAFGRTASTGTGSSSSSIFGGGSSSSTGSAVNKPSSTGAGSSSSSFSGASSSSTGSGLNRLGSTGTGSSSSSLFNSGSSSSTGSGLSKSGSTYGSAASNPSSSGTGLNKPVQTGRGSSTSGSSTGSTGSSSFFGSSSSSSNKPATNAKPSSGFGSSSTSTAKSGSSSSGFGSWLGFGNTNSGQSKTGTGTGKGPSNGNGFGGTGSSVGGGRTSGPGGSPVSVSQHLQDLQRFIYPPGPEEKQDLSRVLG